MKIKLPITCLVLCFLFLSYCKKDKTGPKYADINIVTGLKMFDDNGQGVGIWKSPNDNPGDVLTYPNPMRGIVYVQSQDIITQLWLTPADCDIDNTENIPTLSQNLTYEQSEIETIQIKDIPASNNNLFALDFSDVGVGFYKLFYKMENGDIFWRNLYYVDPNTSNIDIINEMDNSCN